MYVSIVSRLFGCVVIIGVKWLWCVILSVLNFCLGIVKCVLVRFVVCMVVIVV